MQHAGNLRACAAAAEACQHALQRISSTGRLIRLLLQLRTPLHQCVLLPRALNECIAHVSLRLTDWLLCAEAPKHADKLSSKAEEHAQKVADKAKPAAEDASKKVEGTAKDVAGKAQPAAEEASDKLHGKAK